MMKTTSTRLFSLVKQSNKGYPSFPQRAIFSLFKSGAAKAATTSGCQSKLIDMDAQLKIDQYRGMLEDFLLEFDKYERYLGDMPTPDDLKDSKLIPGFATVEGTQRFK